ncbi:hypothetical protein K450DRAFT_263969 [Umbelopsis ramanniana AG]|uniref:Uncharacterized protein n=1 Tax=Umbelopsis ramanniana AG TaxID=1314678 RepID=A0AAD5H9X2_UMBRA|nr:uncharacterized protein K450DRAFT_263969 [Umbelopsis ramanniana AG]KAI8574966.1 hypothetical protein K450DRAFT_263969 [Umbelopsis ramanniana AG]
MKASPVKYVCYFRTRVAVLISSTTGIACTQQSCDTHNRQHQSIKRINEYYACYTTKYHSIKQPHD